MNLCWFFLLGCANLHASEIFPSFMEPNSWNEQQILNFVGTRRFFLLFLILGKRADHPINFHSIPYLFYHSIFVSNCSMFCACVKRMGPIVQESDLDKGGLDTALSFDCQTLTIHQVVQSHLFCSINRV